MVNSGSTNFNMLDNVGENLPTLQHCYEDKNRAGDLYKLHRCKIIYANNNNNNAKANLNNNNNRNRVWGKILTFKLYISTLPSYHFFVLSVFLL